MKEVLVAKGFFCADCERMVPSCSGWFNNLKCLSEFIKLHFMSRATLNGGV